MVRTQCADQLCKGKDDGNGSGHDTSSSITSTNTSSSQHFRHKHRNTITKSNMCNKNKLCTHSACPVSGEMLRFVPELARLHQIVLLAGSSIAAQSHEHLTLDEKA